MRSPTYFTRRKARPVYPVCPNHPEASMQLEQPDYWTCQLCTVTFDVRTKEVPKRERA